MAGGVEKLQSSVTNAPLGALGGAIVGYLVAKKLGYEKSLPVISFTMVGILIGSAIGANIKNKA